ncbi:glutamate racemase [Noviherbaspirillum galbum]|uniref:Glutamate racemase n=1 Tax=Noviherbaspirillum galbum TaxID=2709383 RepID=A0A6B3SI69_9BURK|nr:glutamate racemase [Noviherbaspirillum galbum]NEX60328.1 glutamate racemase [Noviherbaspirillum galbum]
MTSTTADHAPMGTAVPIGVFDSGIGGLSVLRHIRALLPQADLIYFSDAAYAPYGGRSEEDIRARSVAITDFLAGQGIGALVVACNTATAAAIAALRARHPALPIVGVEPGLKPAAAATRSGIVGVLATERTLASARFQALHDQVQAATQVRFLTQACHGLADQVEKGELRSADTARLLGRYLPPLLDAGADTLVLGCTHYPFVRPLIEEIAFARRKSPVTIIDTGEPVARQLVRLVGTACPALPGSGRTMAFTTGNATALRHAFKRLLALEVEVTHLLAE